MLKYYQIPILHDNYVYIIRNESTNQTAIVDPGRAKAPMDFIRKKGWSVDCIINTHHHWDHTDGNVEIKNATNALVVGYKNDAYRIPAIDTTVIADQKIQICSHEAEIIFVPGHTAGHIAYYFKEMGWLFSGDVIFAMGCGRLLEGTPEQMQHSLERLAQLPDETLVFCTHEYSLYNGKFAQAVEPKNKNIKQRLSEIIKLREKNLPTVPTTIGIEKKTNPFFRSKSVMRFAKIRKRRNEF